MKFNKVLSAVTAFCIVFNLGFNIFGSASSEKDDSNSKILGSSFEANQEERSSNEKLKDKEKKDFDKRKIKMTLFCNKDNLTDEDGEFIVNLKVENTNRNFGYKFNIDIEFNIDTCLELEDSCDMMKNIELKDYFEYEFSIKINKNIKDKRESIKIVLSRNIDESEDSKEVVLTYDKVVSIKHVAKKAVIIVPGIVGSEIFSATPQDVYGVHYAENHRIWPPEDTSKFVDTVMRSKQIGGNSDEDSLSDDVSGGNDDRSAIKIMGVDTDRLINDFKNLICNDNGESKLATKPSYPFNCRTEANERFFGSADVYSTLANSLVANDFLNKNHYDVIFFSYDWRNSNAKSAAELEDFINNQHYSDVILVSHSMGGLVCTSYLSKPENRNKVNKFISLGTPFLGANKAINVVETGEFFDGLIGAVIAPVGNPLIKSIVKNCRSVYELFPPRQIFEKTKETVLEEISFSYGFCCFCKSQKSQPVRSFEKFIELLSNRWTSHIYNIPKISDFLSDAQKFHDTLYTHDGTSVLLELGSSKFYNIVGYNLLTIGTTYISYNIDTDDLDSLGEIDYSQVADGDGTVTVTSATIANTLSKNSYRVKKVDHMGLISNESVIELIKNIICGCPGVYDDKIIEQKFD